MANEDKLKQRFELLWWVVTTMVVLIVLYPIFSSVKNFPFYFINVVYIVVFITISRYLFFLRYTFFAKWQRLKLAFIFLCIPLAFLLIQELNTFQTFLDEEGRDAIVRNLKRESRPGMFRYIYNEMLLFGVGSIITTILFPFRLVLSVWRTQNDYRD